jgi:membrane associated rhomboid family serine protease
VAPKWVLAAGLVGAYLVQAAVENAGADAAGGSGRASIFLLRHLALSLDGLQRGEAWQVVTYALLHAGLSHLFWNAASLVMFLRVNEDQVPPRRA